MFPWDMAGIHMWKKLPRQFCYTAKRSMVVLFVYVCQSWQLALGYLVLQHMVSLPPRIWTVFLCCMVVLGLRKSKVEVAIYLKVEVPGLAQCHLLTLYWPKEVMRPAQLQGVRRQILLPDGKNSKDTLQRGTGTGRCDLLVTISVTIYHKKLKSLFTVSSSTFYFDKIHMT